MKSTYLSLIFLGISILFISCKQCTTCEVYDGSGNVISPKTKTCGNANDVEIAKDRARDQAALISGTYVCEYED